MIEVIQERGFAEAAFNTVSIGLIVSFINLAAGIYFGKRLAGKRNSVLDTVTMTPLIVPLFLMMSFIHISMIKIGIIDNLASVVFIHLLPSLPYSIKICQGAYSDLGNKYFEQASIMGASKPRMFFEVSLPLLKSAYQYVFMLSFAISAGQYATTAIIGGGSVVTLSMLYFPFFNSLDSAYMLAFSIVFVAIPLLVFFTFKLLYGIIQMLTGWL